jgi:hypothetical protein
VSVLFPRMNWFTGQVPDERGDGMYGRVIRVSLAGVVAGVGTG